GLRALQAQQQQTDRALESLKEPMKSLVDAAPEAIATRLLELGGYLGRLPDIRAQLSAENTTITKTQVNDYYNRLLDTATSLFDTQARIVPDVTASQGGIAATALFRATDLMSRETETISTALAAHSLSPDDYARFTNIVGSYRSELDKTAP